jgi:hypothetical protein
MTLTDIFRKTHAGQLAFSSGATSLPQALKMLLIMVDGRHDVAHLMNVAKVFGEPKALLQELLDKGLIEPLSSASTEPPPAAQPTSEASVFATTTPLNTPSMLGELAGGTASLRQIADIERATKTLRIEASRFLEAKLGPTSEALRLRIERAKSQQDLATLLDGARAIVAEVRGEKVAKELDALIDIHLAFPSGA